MGKLQLHVTSPPLRCGKKYWRVFCDIKQGLCGYTELKFGHTAAYEGFLQFLHQLLKMALFSQIFFLMCVYRRTISFCYCQTGIL